MLSPPIRRAFAALAPSPLRGLLALASVAVTLYVTIAPLVSAYYPPMTDLPFHTAHASILRHYWDPRWHFHEQFALQPIAVPYMSHYALGALFMLAMRPIEAMKVATALLLLLVPGGMAVLLHGMKKSPFGALLTLPLIYSSLTHWGFISYVSALGLFAMAIGFAMLTVDRPTPLRRAGLSISLVLLFFTHIFRFPMGLAAVVGAAVLLYPATRRFRPILLPLAPPLALLALWLVVRPAQLDTGGMKLTLDWHRIQEMWPLLFGGFNDPTEGKLATLFIRIGLVVGAASLVGLVLEDRFFGATRRARWFAIGATIVPLVSALVFLCLFLALPMMIGVWWYVYPREITAAVYIAIALFPSLPRAPAARAPMITALAVAALAYGRFVSQGYAAFDAQTADFRRVTSRIPSAPRLLYLIFDHSGGSRAQTPFIHLPAYVQAEHGGFLSFNFAAWGASPIVFRPPSDPIAVRPPPTPHRWEWMPQIFKVKQHGAFFDWFLVRSGRSADAVFQDDPEIVRVDHAGKWWLYKRVRGAKK